MKPLFLLIFFLFFPSATLAEKQDIILSEIQIAGEKTHDDFIELHNRSTTPIDLAGFQIRKHTSGSSEVSIKVFEKNSIVPGKGYFLWANKESVYAEKSADTTTGETLSKGNGIGIFTQSGKEGVLIDSIVWGDGTTFSAETPRVRDPSPLESIKRDTESLSWDVTSSTSPTNARGETWRKPDEPKKELPENKEVFSVRINEIFPNPKERGDTTEWIELFNEGITPVSLAQWKLSKKSSSYTFPKASEIQAQEFLIIPRSESKLALKNAGLETIVLLDENENIQDQVSYNTTKEEASYNFYTKGSYRWSRKMTPGKENHFNTLPEKKNSDIPKKGYQDIPLIFSAKGKDSDREALKYIWDFGDRHKSFRKETTHTYKENGTYQGTLTISDGTEEHITTFTVKIEKYVAPKVRIREFEPNPKGNDSKYETVEIENVSKERVNLMGWSIATGGKNLVNHPIRNDFWIDKKSKKILTRADAAFSLNNKKGKIELRTPNGKTIQKIRYSFEDSIMEGLKMKKEKGKKWAVDASKKISENTLIQGPQKTISKIQFDQEKRLREDTIALLSRKNSGLTLQSRELPPEREIQNILSQGTSIKTPLVVLSLPINKRGEPKTRKDFSEKNSTSSVFETTNALINAILE